MQTPENDPAPVKELEVAVAINYNDSTHEFSIELRIGDVATGLPVYVAQDIGQQLIDVSAFAQALSVIGSTYSMATVQFGDQVMLEHRFVRACAYELMMKYMRAREEAQADGVTVKDESGSI